MLQNYEIFEILVEVHEEYSAVSPSDIWPKLRFLLLPFENEFVWFPVKEAQVELIWKKETG